MQLQPNDPEVKSQLNNGRETHSQYIYNYKFFSYSEIFLSVSCTNPHSQNAWFVTLKKIKVKYYNYNCVVYYGNHNQMHYCNISVHLDKYAVRKIISLETPNTHIL